MKAEQADVVIVGSGITGTLVARELVGAGRSVVMLERGGHRSHAQQLRDRRHAADEPGARHNHEIADGSPEHPWNYVYGVGGSSLHWTGVTPRFVASDFRMRSAYGVMQDWPVALDELEPYYRTAERLLAVAGSPGGQPAHPFSPIDRALRGPLAPYAPLPQARPTRPVGNRPACCASATCELCPVDSRFSVLNGLGDVLASSALDLRPGTAVDRVLTTASGPVAGVRCVRAGAEPYELRAGTVVLAAGGFENPGVLLRSGLDHPDVGRFLFDHAHRTLIARVGRDVGPGQGSSLATGASDAFRDGAFRSRRGAAYVSAFNPGVPLEDALTEAVLAGRDGAAARRDALEAWRRTVVLDVLLDDVPQPERQITLSRSRDDLGLPRLRVAYRAPTAYEDDGWVAVREGVRERLRPLGLRQLDERLGPAGSHLLGTCRMGGVVDGDLRHRDVEGLYVAGGSAFPTYSPAHPTLTIAALALRLGRELARS